MNIYHIYHTPETKEVSLMFWGCNFDCKGCYCKRRIYNPMLKDFLGIHIHDDPGLAEPPEQFLDLEEVLHHLDDLDIERVLLEGQEPSIDPEYARLTRALHERYGTHNTLLTNGFVLPGLEDTDKVALGIKTVTNSLHKNYTGKPNWRVLQNLSKLSREGMELVVEVVFIPGYIDVDEIRRVAGFISGIDREIPLVILPYFKAGNNSWRRPTPKEMEGAGDMAKQYLKTVYSFRGDEEVQNEVVSVFPDNSVIQRTIVPSCLRT